MSESDIFKRGMLAASRLGAVLFRNSVGLAWFGRARRLRPGEVVHAHGGEVLIVDARQLRAGLHVGSGDGIGWHSIIITPEMVGHRVAVFLSAESKSNNGRLSAEQKNWLEQVRAAGGIAFVFRSDDEFTELLQKYFPLAVEKK